MAALPKYKWKQCSRIGDGAQDAGLGGAFGKPTASEAEIGYAEESKEELDNGREGLRSAVKPCDQVEQRLPVLLDRLYGEDGAQTTPSPGGWEP